MPDSTDPAGRPRRSRAAERILREAMRLFAERGYERTSIADIQAAAGLAPGSGALYKHFRSKEAVLAAGMEDFVAGAERARELIRTVPGPAEDALGVLARAAMQMLQDDQDVMRIVWRELEQFPELLARVRERRMQTTYAALADWLRDRADRGELRVEDPEATAAVLLGGLTSFKVFHTLLGEPPARLDDDRFVQAWLRVMLRGLLPDTRPGS
ncbi:TetR/AcrR family transcriptional regulator [Longimicrobium sp.]|uniref:TetR/AcrR family transcriptional regulator n=1 Tax=Longimicrobium sp. TaxID=2029185 RepID=UPI003B3BDB7D